MKRRRIPGGIRVQVLVPAIMLLCGAMWLITLATFQVTQRALVGQAEERALSHASVLLETIPHIEPASVKETLLLHTEHAGLDFAAWENRDGQLIGSHDGDLSDLSMTYIAMHNKKSVETTHLTQGDSTLLFTSLRSPEGRIIVAMDLRSVKESMNVARQSSYLFMFMNAIFLVALGYAMFTYLVVRPLRTLGLATERASHGDFANPITLIPGNEFGLLSVQFNLMLEQLTAQRALLTEQVEQLASTNDTLLNTQQSLIRSEKMASVGQLAAGVAHEVGNPLAAVYGYSELLADGDVDAESVQHLATRISKQVERMQQIIRELLNYSRNDEDEQIQMAPFQVWDVVTEALELAHATGKIRDVEIDTSRVSNELPEVWGNPSQALQVWLNLLLNMGDVLVAGHGACTIWTTHSDEELAMYIEDNGPGIDAAHINKIFDPFFTTKDPGKGTGLGLAISLRIMNRMQGNLELVEPVHHAHGACFKLTFQRASRSSTRQ